MRRLLNLMVSEGLLDEVVYDHIRKDTDFARMALWEELVGFSRSQSNANKVLGLEDLVERFELSPGNNATKLRRSVVLPLAVLGQISARIDDHNHYEIWLGPVGSIFFDRVFSPVRKQFQVNLEGEKS